MIVHDHPAIRRLEQFTQAMNEWEQKFYPLMRENGHLRKAQASEELRPIFEEYVFENDKNFSRVHAPASEIRRRTMSIRARPKR